MGDQVIGKIIRRKREIAGLSQRQVAEKAGISRFTLIKIETGESDPRISTLKSIAAALNCSFLVMFDPIRIKDRR